MLQLDGLGSDVDVHLVVNLRPDLALLQQLSKRMWPHTNLDVEVHFWALAVLMEG